MAEDIARPNAIWWGQFSTILLTGQTVQWGREKAEPGFQSPNLVSDTETAQSPSHDQYYSLSRLMLSGISCEKASPFSIDFDEVPAISNKTGCQHTSQPVLQRGRLPNKSILFGEGEANLGLGKKMVGFQLLLHACRQKNQPTCLPQYRKLPTSHCIWRHIHNSDKTTTLHLLTQFSQCCRKLLFK